MSATQTALASEAPALVSERARAKESLRYASPFLQRSRRLHSQSLAERADCVRPCADTGLTALVQLGAFKLNVERSMISLFDRQHQHIIAEATQASPLDHKTQDQLGNRRLWLCGTAFPRSPKYPGEHILTGPASERLPVLVVPDLFKDDRWPGELCLEEWPSIRFYAGVPIVSKAGLRIGTYTVLDSRPRSGLSIEEQQFLRDISDTTMRYLQSRTAIENIHRGERMVRGLGSFVEGRTTISSTEDGDLDVSPDSQEGQLNTVQQNAQKVYNEIEEQFGSHSPETLVHRDSFHQERPTLSRLETNCSSTTTGTRSTVTSSCSTSSTSPFFNKLTAPDPRVMELRRTFSRASNVLREAVEVEGALFLDASISSFAGMIENRNQSENSSHKDQSRRGSEAATQYCDIFGFSTSESSSIDDSVTFPDHSQIPERLMSILLSRYPEGKVFNFDLDGDYLSGESELDDSSEGGVPGSRSGLDGRDKTRGRASRVFQSLEGQATAITRIFPDARSVVIVPLWDSVKERWFACGIIWTNSPNRLFTVEGELSFLRAFGTTIMAEVQRINASMSEKAKNDFLGSLSHELRSPLHGVIAAVELLNDSDVDAFQGDAVHTIETSGRTLLDTLDHVRLLDKTIPCILFFHRLMFSLRNMAADITLTTQLLDYSKINTYLTSSKLARRGSRADPSLSIHTDLANSSKMLELTADVQLDLLVEEAAECVYAGYSFQRKSFAQVMGEKDNDRCYQNLDSIAALEAFGHDMDDTAKLHRRQGDVLCYVDIDPTVTWDFRAQPGAVRRIIMNLFGNSLKFTHKGFIWISLRQLDISTRDAPRRCNVILTISDSGSGIGEDFLRNSLFTPFSQENNHTPGTGLGLSLVRQISTTLGGCVTFTSQSGEGTTAQITLPMSHASHAIDKDKDLVGYLEELQDARICLRGFDRCFERVMEETDEQPSSVSEAAIMETLCRDWLGMRTIPCYSVEDKRPDLFLLSELAFTDQKGQDTASKLSVPTVVVCRDAFTAHDFAKSPEKTWNTEFISQPVGHRRLARSLASCLYRWKQRSASSTRLESREGTPRPGPRGARGRSEGIFKPVEPVPESRPRNIIDPEFDSAYLSTSSSRLGMITEAQNGRGSKFLPEKASTQMVSDQLKAGSGLRKYLLVDDNDINLRILASFMKKLGYDYDTASNGLEALEMYLDNPGLYPFVLMDISMPIMDGLEATQRMREHEQASNIIPATVIALTGLASASVQREATAKGMNVFLTKPLGPLHCNKETNPPLDLEFQLRPIIISLPQTPYLSTLFATKKPFKTAIRLPPQAQLTYPNSPSRSKNSTGIYGHGGTHQRPPHPQQDLRKHARGARTRVDGIAPVAFTSPLLGRLEMTSMAIEDLRRYDPSQHHSIHMHGTSQSIASQWNTISQPSVLVSIFVALVPLVYKLVQHTAAARGRPLPPFGEILWDTLVFIIPASVLYAIDRWANPPLFPIPMLQPRPTTHADKSDVMRRILRVDQPGGIVASVSQAGKRAYTNTLSSFKGDLSQPAGLVNWDNSCFQNSTLQGLASLKHLPRYLAGLTTSQSVTGDDTSTTAGSLRAFIADLNDPSNNGKTLRAPGVLRNMSTIQQQDAQEYFSKLVDQVDKDVEKSAKATCRLPGLEAELSRDDTVASQHSDDSGYQSLPMLSKAGSELMTIRNPLEGLSAQRVACTACGYSEGLSMIPFNCLTLNFEIGVSDYSLFELLNNYVQLESISSVDCAKCTLLGYAKKLQQMAKVIPAAAERLEAVERMLEEDEFDDESMKKLRITDSNKVSSTKTKQVAIGRAPPSLVMHMNRSVFDPMTFRSYKNLAAVRFPKLLDLGPWCIGSAEGVDMASEVGADDRKESQRPENVAHKEQWVLDATASMVAGDSHPSKISGPIYELRAVVTHYGRHDNGHYICYRKHPRGTTNASEGAKAKEGADQPPNLMGDEQPDGVGGTNGSSTEHTASAPKDPEELYSEDEDSQWWRLSDETVSKVSEKDVLSQGGVFMLFYDCIDPNSILITPGEMLEAENPLETTSTSTKQAIRKSPSWSDESVTTLCNAHADQEYAASEASSVTMVTEGEHGSAKKYDGISHVMTVTELSDEEHETAEQDAEVADDSSVAFSRASSVTMVGEENHASWSGTGGNSVTNNTATRSERVPV